MGGHTGFTFDGERRRIHECHCLTGRKRQGALASKKRSTWVRY
jgi:hypothetical protein